MKIILGSKSKSRSKILEEMGIEFGVMSADIDEKAIRLEDPKELVLALAKAKAEALKGRIAEPALLITSDQVVVCQGRILEKPETAAEARAFLEGYNLYPAETVTSVVVTNLETGKQVETVDVVKVFFKSFSDIEIDALIAEGDLFHYAGGFNEQWTKHIEKIEGARDSVKGLPKDLTRQLMNEVQFDEYPMIAEEAVDVLNAEGKVIGTMSREEAERDNHITQNVLIFIFDSRGKMWVQLRPRTKRHFPGIWDVSVCGGIVSGETPEQAASRETTEEMGMVVDLEYVETFANVFMDDKNQQLQRLSHIFVGSSDQVPKISEEVDEFKSWQPHELRAHVLSNPNLYVPSFLIELDKAVDGYQKRVVRLPKTHFSSTVPQLR